ncbi:MAG TPA: GNAT family N-acetyltransferase [Puia sp.]|jgi:RimJ/RimL family protein N-acetyltransferase|nr:GNAT family N-acetyltransferase [Puia sp.]
MLLLRRWKAADKETFTAMNRDARVMEFFARIWTAEESAAMIAKAEACMDQNGYGPYAVELLDPAGTVGGAVTGAVGVTALAAGDFIGFVGLLPQTFEAWFTPCVEIGWRLRAEAWGCWFATEAATECLRFGLDEVGLERIYSTTAVPNIRSERVMQKIGMRKAGEFEHPRLEEGSWLRTHVLYEATRTVIP